MAQTLDNLSYTWNNSGITFTGIKYNVTDTASNAASLLMDLQVGGVSKFKIGKDGSLTLVGNGSFAGVVMGKDGNTIPNIVSSDLVITTSAATNTGFIANFIGASKSFNIKDTGYLSFTSGYYITATDQARLYSGGTHTFEQRNGTNAQTFRLYNTYTDASNYERGFIRWNTSVLEIGAEAGGTGVQRQLQFLLGTVTVSTPLSITQTWNASAVAFTGIRFNITDTASAAASLLMDLQVGGTSKFKIAKSGSVEINSSGIGGSITGAYGTTILSLGTNSISFNYLSGNGAGQVNVDSNGIVVSPSLALAFASANYAASPDVFLRRDSANTLAQRNGTNAQTSRLYGTYTDASNYRRLTQTMSAAGVAEIKPEGAGTGASGNVLYISGLPTSNPGPGILWNNAGVVNVGT